jgi:hypothetical protein
MLMHGMSFQVGGNIQPLDLRGVCATAQCRLQQAGPEHLMRQLGFGPLMTVLIDNHH